MPWTWVKLCPRDFPGGPVVKNPPSNAGDVPSVPGQGAKIPRAAGQFSLGTTRSEEHTSELQSLQ